MLEGESVTVEVTVDPSERIASARKGGGIGSRTPLLAATVVFALCVTFGRDFLYNSVAVPFGVAATLASVAGLFFFLIILNAFAYFRRARTPAPRSTLVQDFKLTAAPDGLHVAAENMTAHYDWRGILRLNETDTHLYLYTDGAQTIAVPKRCFTSREQASRFAIVVRSQLGERV